MKIGNFIKKLLNKLPTCSRCGGKFRRINHELNHGGAKNGKWSTWTEKVCKKCWDKFPS